MPYELFIGLRYLKAKRKQAFISVITFISILGISVGVSALIIVLSVMAGFEETLRERILGLNAHIAVVGFEDGLSDYEEVARKVRGVEGVIGASPFTYNQAMLSGPGGVTGVVVRGVDTETVGSVTVLPERVVSGKLEGINVPFGETGKTPGIVIGSELARSLGARVGDRITAISPLGTMTPAGPTPRVATFEVAGIFEVGMFEYDSSLAFTSLENTQVFFRLDRRATGVEVKVEDLYRAEEMADRLMVELKGPYWARTWMDMNRNLFSALRLEKVTMFIILMLIILVAGLNIISTLIMVVMEKHKDIAILKSLGATRTGIMKIFMIDGLLIGLTGTVLGTAAGVAASVKLEGIVSFIEDLFKFKVLPPSIYYIDRLPSKVEPGMVVLVALVSIAISFFATIYPSWQASRLDPVESLRYE